MNTLMAMESPGTLSAHKSVFSVLFGSASSKPDREAIVYEEERISYRHILERSAAVAKQLQECGVKRGDRVGVLFPNHPDYVAAFFAIAGLGATIVPINPLLKSEEISHILSDSGSRVLVVHELGLDEALRSQKDGGSLEKILVSSKSNEFKHDTELKVEQLTTERIEPSKFNWVQDIQPEKELALIVYTSGTTGKPKGAMLTHRNVLAVFPDRLDIIGLTDSDRTLAVLPMCHIYGITVLMIGTISRGATLIVLPKFDAAAALSIIEQERVTLVPAVPAMHRFMIMELDKTPRDTKSVRLSMSGGASLDADLIPEIESKFPSTTVLEGYALTETACAATLNPLFGARKPGSVGPALAGVDIEIRSEEGQDLPAGVDNVGQLWIRGENVMTGYYNLPDATDECMKSGWFATGDLAYKDEDGYIYIVGRKKELIIRGGQNIYPKEIEDVIVRLPGVLEAAVIGVPDKLMGERVKAIVVKRAGAELTEDEVKEFCAERLAEYKVPRLVEFRDSLPRNSTGKVLKRNLK